MNAGEIRRALFEERGPSHLPSQRYSSGVESIINLMVSTDTQIDAYPSEVKFDVLMNKLIEGTISKENTVWMHERYSYGMELLMEFRQLNYLIAIAGPELFYRSSKGIQLPAAHSLPMCSAFAEIASDECRASDRVESALIDDPTAASPVSCVFLKEGHTAVVDTFLDTIPR